MENKDQEHLTQLDNAFRLVGRFLYEFALLEDAIDAGLAKILDLKGAAAKIATANMDFSRKVRTLRSAEVAKAAKPNAERKKFVDDTFSRIMEANNWRIIVAHSTFRESKSGVKFVRVVADKKLKVTDEIWTERQFADRYALMEVTAASVTRMVEEMVPFRHSLDFSDPRNSGYLTLIS